MPVVLEPLRTPSKVTIAAFADKIFAREEKRRKSDKRKQGMCVMSMEVVGTPPIALMTTEWAEGAREDTERRDTGRDSQTEEEGRPTHVGWLPPA